MVVSQKVKKVKADPAHKATKVHEKLYNERNMYFERKRSQRNSQIEEQLKQCTFIQNDRKCVSRSF
jgi:mevalonate pyrophosphate decarboxylase